MNEDNLAFKFAYKWIEVAVYLLLQLLSPSVNTFENPDADGIELLVKPNGITGVDPSDFFI